MQCLPANAQSLFSRYMSKTEAAQLLVLGLDASGKTSILSRLQTGKFEVTVPTLGLNEVKFRYGSWKFTAKDVGGRKELRPLWQLYYKSTDALVFVVDSGDRTRLWQAREEFQKVLAAEEMRNAAVLVFANKQDSPTALSALEIACILGLVDVAHMPWHVAPCITMTGEGIDAGMDWLVTELSAARSIEVAESQDYWSRQTYRVNVGSDSSLLGKRLPSQSNGNPILISLK